jgi:uncharacterized protein YmfQ (DUF2313 family)
MSDVLIEQLQALLPPVVYNPMAPGVIAELNAEANALGEALALLEGAEGAIFPETAGDYIADWERVYALTPAPGESQEDRVNAVIAALGDLGGQSIPYFIALARRLGVVVSVDVNRPALTDIAVVGDPATDGDALYEWRVNAPLSAYRKPALETLISLRKPANTEASVGYGKSVAVLLAASADRLFNATHYVTPEAING